MIVWLQWGHVFSDVEMDESVIDMFGKVLLQWGHVFSDVEMIESEKVAYHTAKASMGPRLFRRGNGSRI